MTTEPLYSKSKEFEQKLQGLADLQADNGKLGVCNEITYVSWTFFQGIQRLYYGESCEKLLLFLKDIIDKYCIFTDTLQKKICQVNDMDLLILRRHNKNSINNWITGLTNLQKTYSGEKKNEHQIENLKQKLFNECFP